MKIVLIRHSNSEVEPEKYNPLWRLSEKGVTRANELAQHPLIQNIEVIYTSDQLKAIHTGIIVAAEIGVPLHQVPELTELTSLTNEWKADFDGFVHDIYTGVIERWKDGESLEEARMRFSGSIAEIVQNTPEHDTIGIVAHGNVLSLFAAEYEERTAHEIHQIISQPDLAVFDWKSKTFETTFGTYE